MSAARGERRSAAGATRLATPAGGAAHAGAKQACARGKRDERD